MMPPGNRAGSRMPPASPANRIKPSCRSPTLSLRARPQDVISAHVPLQASSAPVVRYTHGEECVAA